MATPIGLAANKTLMDNKFKMLTNPTMKGNMYDCAYQAYKNLCESAMKNSDIGAVSDADISPLANAANAEAKQKIEQDSKKFAEDICKGMDKVLEEISTQIDAHIKAMMITIMAPTPGPSGTVLACGVGPVSGTIGANNLTPTGGITIS
jgi:hypothetical protein